MSQEISTEVNEADLSTSPEIDIREENFDSEMAELQKIVDSASKNAETVSDNILPTLLEKAKTITNLKQLEIINGMIMSLTSLHTSARSAIDSKLKIKNMRFNQRVKLKPADVDANSVSANDLKALLDKIGYSSQITINNFGPGHNNNSTIDAEFDEVFDNLVSSGEIKPLEIPDEVELKK